MGERSWDNDGPPVSHTWWKTTCVLVTSIFVLLAVVRVEWYPVSAWPMYSGKTESATIRYLKVFAYDPSGDREEVHLDRWIGGLADARFRGVLERSRLDQDALIAAVIRVACDRLSPQRITSFEVRTYEWNYHESPNDPRFGRAVSHVRYPVACGGTD